MKKVAGFLFALALCAAIGCGGGGNSPASSSSKEMTEFKIVSPVVATGIIDESAKTVAVKVPYGTAVTAMIAGFMTTGVKTCVGETEQMSGITENNFTDPVSYTVTAQDGTLSTYRVTVTKDAASMLSSLVLSDGTLSPAFDPATENYTASVANAVSSITVTPTVEDSTATVKVNGTAVVSGSSSSAISLNVGLNTITVEVMAQSGTVNTTYTVTVTRIIDITRIGTKTNYTVGSLSFNMIQTTPDTIGSGIVFPTGVADDGTATITTLFMMAESDTT